MADTGPITGITPTRPARRTKPGQTKQRPRQGPGAAGDEEDDSPTGAGDKRGRKGRFIDERC